jgi:hypothetical protein
MDAGLRTEGAAMRRFFVILAGISVVSTGMACQHTAGRCDCLPPLPHCTKYGLYTPEMAADHVVMKQEVLPPVTPPKVIPTAVISTDIGEPVTISPSDGASGYGD